MMTGAKLSKLTCSNGKQLYLSTSGDSTGDLKLLITDTVKAWTGSVTKEELSTSGKDVNVDDFEAQSRKALTGEDVTSFEYELKDECKKSGLVRLVWKKLVEPDHIKFQLGSVVLKPVTDFSDAVSSMFDHLLNSTSDLRQQIDSLKFEQQRLATERSEALKKLAECANIKEDTEQDLYAKFVIVLNDKKAKIRQLKDELEAAQMGNASTAATDSKYAGDRPSAHDRRTSTDKPSGSTDGDDDDEKDRRGKQCTVTSSKSAADDKKSRDDAADADADAAAAAADADDSSVDLMLDDSVADGDIEQVPVGPKRAANRKRQTSETEASSSNWQPVPMMLSWTGTTNTSTTSSDHQRWREKSKVKKDKDESSPKRTNSVSRTAEIDDLIGDMA